MDDGECCGKPRLRASYVGTVTKVRISDAVQQSNDESRFSRAKRHRSEETARDSLSNDRPRETRVVFERKASIERRAQGELGGRAAEGRRARERRVSIEPFYVDSVRAGVDWSSGLSRTHSFVGLGEAHRERARSRVRWGTNRYVTFYRMCLKTYRSDREREKKRELIL